ncbi:unnamed protein product [Ectocarpus sp. 13 AM-2016]
MPANPGRFPWIFLFVPRVRRFASYARTTQVLSAGRYGSRKTSPTTTFPTHETKAVSSLNLSPARSTCLTVSNYLLVWTLLSTNNIENAYPLSGQSAPINRKTTWCRNRSSLSPTPYILTAVPSTTTGGVCSTRCYGNPKRSKRSNP